MSRHTEAPWSVINEREEWPEVKVGGEKWGVLASTTVGREESYANAHLIAAAPELLEALEAVETELLSDRFNLSGQTQDQIRAAIRKAKGGQHE